MAWSFDEYLPIVTARESGGRDDAKNPTSSASGRYQFIDSTYLPLAREAFPGRSDDALMSMKNDPAVQNTVMKTFTTRNADLLTRNGIDLNNGSVYAAHFLGGPGAVRALTARDDTPIADVVNPGSLAANRGVFKSIATVGDFKKWAGSYGAGKADLPASDAVPVSYNGGGLNSGTAFDIPGGAPAKLGPAGGLISPPGGFTPATETAEPWSAADALTGAGAALMSVYNPTGAQALMAGMRDRKKEKRSTPWEIKSYDPATGRGLYVNSETGQVQPQQFSQPFKELTTKERAEFDDRHEKLSVYDETINDANKYRNMIANGEIDLSAASQFAAGARKLTDQSTQADRNAADYALFNEKLRNASLRLNSGVQTEGDAVRAINEIAPKMSKYDNAASLNALDGIIKTSRNRVDSLVKNQNSIYETYGEQAPRGTYRDDYRNAMNRYQTLDEEYTPRRDAFLKARDAANANPASSPSPRVAPARGSDSGGSFGDFMKKRLGL